MFKVVCINGNGWVDAKPTKKYWWSKNKCEQKAGPKIDDVVTVTKEEYIEGKKYYYLLEWPHGKAYHSAGFRLLEEKFEKVTFSEIKEIVEVSKN